MTDAGARQDMLDTIAVAVDEVAYALASVGEAYDRLDENTADRLEDALFRPLQTAYGRAQRTHAAFAERHKLPGRQFSPGHAAVASHGAGPAIEDAIAASQRADETISELQDSMAPIEYGDPELRAGLADVRTLLAQVPVNARGFLRTLGR